MKKTLYIILVLALALAAFGGSVAAQDSVTLTISRWAGPHADDQIEVIKQFEEESNLKAYFLLDTSASMQFPQNSLSKLQYGKILTASLAYLLLKQRDAAGLFCFNETIQRYIPPRSHLGHLQVLIDALENSEASGQTQLAQTLDHVAERISRRGLIIVVSDLLENRTAVLEGLRLLRHRKHDVLIFHILTREELEFPYRGYVRFHDLETQRDLLTDPNALRHDYLESIRELIDFYRNGCLQHHLDYSLLTTHLPLDRALSTYLHRRMSRLKG